MLVLHKERYTVCREALYTLPWQASGRERAASSDDGPELDTDGDPSLTTPDDPWCLLPTAQARTRAGASDKAGASACGIHSKAANIPTSLCVSPFC
jgi:hypothetical protein